jgi:hypothetical protein
MISLGLDASTTCVGWAFTSGSVILDCGFYDISDYKGNRLKSHRVISLLADNPLIKNIGRVNLEGSLSGFSGPSSRTVVMMLARYNSVLEYVLQDSFRVPVNLVGAMTARKQVLGAARLEGMKPKEFVKMKMDKLYDLSKWEVKNKKGNVDKRMEDVRDACVIALYNPPL